MRSRRCSTCKFYAEEHCHRAPPRTDARPEGFTTTFPIVHPFMWCGEWKLAWRQFFKLFNRKDQP
jgi:hypothetical protein